jgi:hypothetical protein
VEEFKGRRLKALAVLMLIAFGMSVLQPGVAGAQNGPSCTATITSNTTPAGFVVTTGAGSITFVADTAVAVGGLQSLTLLAGAVNANVSIPAFAVGTTGPVTVTFTVTDPTQDADFAVQAGDEGNHHTVIAAEHCVGVPACNPNICVVTQGFWKNHPLDWPVTTLTLGTVTYNQAQLLSILGEPVRGNGLVSLSKQLIAAKLNQANGACVPTAVATAITQADALIGGAIVPPVGSGVLDPSATSALNTILDNYNNGLAAGGPSHCN